MRFLAVLCLIALLSSGGVFAQEATIGFEGLPAGTILSSVNASSGGGDVGPIGVFATKPSTGPATNVGLIFDSANPPGIDFDLGTPNETFGGPGIGTAGEMGMPNENGVALGNLLCFAEDLIDADMDGLIDIPNDADEMGMVMEFDFSGITSPSPVSTVTVLSVTAIDIEQDQGELPATIDLYDAADMLIASFAIGDIGDNGVKTVETGAPGIGTAGVARMEIVLQGSGAIDNVIFLAEGPEPGSIGDTVYCDVNDNGVQDPGEPGIPGVTVDLVCAGPDGMIGTADDLVDSQVTDADGMYLFVDLPAGLCEVSVDPTTAGDKVPGQCPLLFIIDLQPGQSFLDADFCFVEEDGGGGQGCTPGYWKQPHHLDSWVGFDPSEDYETVFGVDASFTKTLLGALQQGGGGQKALGRHAVAALLNANNPDVDYAFDVGDVIAIVQDAYATGDFEGAKNMLAFENEAGCPLN